ncbi:cyclic nucleotide-binding domain-containing protein [Planctomycetota bacterium]
MLTIEEKAEVLASSPIFEFVSEEVIHKVAERSGEVDVAAGETLFGDGEPGDSVFLVASGEIEVVKEGLVLAVLGRGDMVGEMVVLAGGLRNATVKTRSNSVLLFLKAGALRLLIQQMPDVAFGIFGMLVKRLRKADESIIALSERKSSIATLKVMDGPDAEKSFEMVGGRIEIGRATGSIIEDCTHCALTPPAPALESEQKAEIVHTGDTFFLQPVDASDPPLLNGEKIEGSVELSRGDVITSVGTNVKFMPNGAGDGD